MIDGQLVSLRRPTLADHEAVRGIWEDEATMRDVGGVCPLPPEKWERWHRRMFHELASANEYFLVYENSSGTCAGEVSFHDFDPSSGRAMFNVKIKRHLRGKGLGREAIDLILWHFFGAWEGTVMEDSLWEGNPGGLAVVLAYGFRETRRDADGIWVELDRQPGNASREHSPAGAGIRCAPRPRQLSFTRGRFSLSGTARPAKTT
ncbi:MAG TPA: GNAT family N-acetyltransferase [Spirochaetales bacterium]|nr:GNAT family N-acetyltransferase [Spirochaetales bacterium]